MSEQFREGSSLVMFTSDVSARGMDYPGLLALLVQKCILLVQRYLLYYYKSTRKYSLVMLSSNVPARGIPNPGQFTLISSLAFLVQKYNY